MVRLPPTCCMGCQHLNFSIDPILKEVSYTRCQANVVIPTKKNECKRQKSLGDRKMVWVINEGI